MKLNLWNEIPIFSNPDMPEAWKTLQETLRVISTYPIVGLIIKVGLAPDGKERIVNWTFADADLVRLLSFVLLKP